MKRVLFIGRFQPFHLGHLAVLKEIDRRHDLAEIIIGIGSSQYGGTNDNPFDFAQRKSMINQALANELKNSYRIFAISDVHSNDLWVDHVCRIVGEFDEVYTGNDLVKRLFLARNFPIRPVKNYQGITATKIRRMIKNGDQAWKKLVPRPVVEFICKN